MLKIDIELAEEIGLIPAVMYAGIISMYQISKEVHKDFFHEHVEKELVMNDGLEWFKCGWGHIEVATTLTEEHEEAFEMLLEKGLIKRNYFNFITPNGHVTPLRRYIHICDTKHLEKAIQGEKPFSIKNDLDNYFKTLMNIERKKALENI